MAAAITSSTEPKLGQRSKLVKCRTPFLEIVKKVPGQMVGQVAFTTNGERPQYEASEEQTQREKEEGEEEGKEEVQEGYGEAEEEIRSALARMYTAQPSRALDRYFTTLKDGSREWNEETLKTGICAFAAIAGCQRAEYFETPWSGLHYPTEIKELWRRTYPLMPCAVMDQNSGWVCPATWSHTFENATCTLTYCGSTPLSQGLNELATGPTSLDCGMFCQVLIWMGLRYMTGDDIFDRAFARRQFKIVQSWEKPGPEGNPLYPLYDRWSDSGTRIHTRTVYNHPSYLQKHPGGSARLQNTTQVDDEYLTFHPTSTCKSLSFDGVQQKLVEAYNTARDFADKEAMALWKRYPNYIHPALAPNCWGEMLIKSFESADNIIDVDRLRRE